MSDNRSIAYREDKASIYRASGIGSCVKALVAAMLGYEEGRGTYTQNILDLAAKEGTRHETHVVEDLEELNYRVDASQQTVQLRIIPGVYIRGHIDGIVKVPKGRKNRVLEIKSMSKNRFKNWSAPDRIEDRMNIPEFERYAWQVSAYMHALDFEAVYAVKNRDSGELLVETLKLPPVDLRELRKKVIDAEKWRVMEELPPCTGNAGELFFCAYSYLHEDSPHGDEENDEDTELDSATQTLIAEFAAEHHRLGRETSKLKALNEERSELGKRIISLMGGKHGPKVVEAGKWQVTRVDSSRNKWKEVELAFALGLSVEDLKAKYQEKFPVRYPRVEGRT